VDASFEEDFNKEEVAIDIAHHDKVTSIVEENFEKCMQEQEAGFQKCLNKPFKWERWCGEEMCRVNREKEDN